MNIYSNRLQQRARNLNFLIKPGEGSNPIFYTQDRSFGLAWNVERGIRYVPQNLDSMEMGIVDVLMEFFNKGRIFNLSPREIENYLRDENHLRAYPEGRLSEKTIQIWIRETVRGYFSCVVPQKKFPSDFSLLNLVQKINSIKEIIGELHLNLLKIQLVDLDGYEIVLSVGLEKPYEESALEGYFEFLKSYFRNYFDRADINLRFEKIL